MSIGIGKRELMEDYYIDESSAIIEVWNDMHRAGKGQTENMSAEAFFGDGGEVIG